MRKDLIIVDQGGGSFTVYSFSSDEELKKKKSKDIAESMRQTEEHNNVLEATKIDLLLVTDEGAMSDYSHLDPKHYPLIAEWFVKYWILADCFKAEHTIIRQTGKIRAKLLEKGNKQLLEAWNAAMKDALTDAGFPNVDYKLLTNLEEALREGECFYKHKGNKEFFDKLQLELINIIGAGIGSSSTQVYAKDKNGNLVVAYDSKLGSKPTEEEKTAIAARKTKSIEEFEDAFIALFKRLLQQGVTLLGATFFATNAIGYCAAKLGEMMGEGNLFSELVKAGMPVETDNYLRVVKQFVTQNDSLPVRLINSFVRFGRSIPFVRTFVRSVGRPSWEANIILGMLQACKNVGISHIVMEKKGIHGKEGLPIEIKWITAFADGYFKQNSAASTSGGGGGAAAEDVPGLPEPTSGGGGGAAASVEAE